MRKSEKWQWDSNRRIPCHGLAIAIYRCVNIEMDSAQQQQHILFKLYSQEISGAVLIHVFSLPVIVSEVLFAAI